MCISWLFFQFDVNWLVIRLNACRTSYISCTRKGCQNICYSPVQQLLSELFECSYCGNRAGGWSAMYEVILRIMTIMELNHLALLVWETTWLVVCSSSTGTAGSTGSSAHASHLDNTCTQSYLQNVIKITYRTHFSVIFFGQPEITFLSVRLKNQLMRLF